MFGVKKKETAIPGEVVNTIAKSHPEIVLNHVSGKPEMFIVIEEQLKSFECMVAAVGVGTFSQDELLSVVGVIAGDLGLRNIQTSAVTEVQYGKKIKKYVSEHLDSAVYYSFILNDKKLLGYWLRGKYIFTVE
jgi:hypothetical protein